MIYEHWQDGPNENNDPATFGTGTAADHECRFVIDGNGDTIMNFNFRYLLILFLSLSWYPQFLARITFSSQVDIVITQKSMSKI